MNVWRMLATAAVVLLVGCENAEHDMYAQPKYRPQAPSPLFADGNSARTPPPGTVVAASGAVAGSSSGTRGHEEGGLAATVEPPLTVDLLQRGHDRFDIFCAPCHGRVGDGDGMVVQRGFPAPGSFHSDRLRDASDQHLFDVISHGTGTMYPFADRLTPADRWTIVAYVRALQLSQHATRSQLDENDLRSLDASSSPGSP